MKNKLLKVLKKVQNACFNKKTCKGCKYQQFGDKCNLNWFCDELLSCTDLEIKERST